MFSFLLFFFLFHAIADFVLFLSRARTLVPLQLWLLHDMTSSWTRTGRPVLFTLPPLIDSQTTIYFPIYLNLLIHTLFSSLSVFLLLFLLFF